MKKGYKKLSNSISGVLLIASLFTVMVFTSVAEAYQEEELIPVLSGTSLTVYEQTGSIFEFTFPVASLMNSSVEFITGAGEKYTITSDGTYLIIHCFHDSSVLDEKKDYCITGERSLLPFTGKRAASRPGNNIVGVRLDGVDGFPDGLWASLIIYSSLGDHGTAHSKINSLGDARICGGNTFKYCTSLGFGHSEIAYGFSLLIKATIDIVPDTFKPEDEYITVSIEMPQGYEVGDIDFSTIMISKVGDAEVNFLPESWSLEIGDYDNDDVSDMGVKFDTTVLEDNLTPGEVPLTITGRFYSGISFNGNGILNVQEKTNPNYE